MLVRTGIYTTDFTRGHREKAVIFKPGREPSLETKFAGTLIMDF
jgi:hypothetical protein